MACHYPQYPYAVTCALSGRRASLDNCCTPKSALLEDRHDSFLHPLCAQISCMTVAATFLLCAFTSGDFFFLPCLFQLCPLPLESAVCAPKHTLWMRPSSCLVQVSTLFFLLLHFTHRASTNKSSLPSVRGNISRF